MQYTYMSGIQHSMSSQSSLLVPSPLGLASWCLPYLPLLIFPWTKWPPFCKRCFWCIFVNEKFCILIKILLKFLSKGPIDDNPALVQIMTWCWIGDKPLSESMLIWFTDTYMQHYRGRWVNHWSMQRHHLLQRHVITVMTYKVVRYVIAPACLLFCLLIVLLNNTENIAGLWSRGLIIYRVNNVKRVSRDIIIMRQIIKWVNDLSNCHWVSLGTKNGTSNICKFHFRYSEGRELKWVILVKQ